MFFLWLHMQSYNLSDFHPVEDWNMGFMEPGAREIDYAGAEQAKAMSCWIMSCFKVACQLSSA